jgi:hypothetical protein
METKMKQGRTLTELAQAIEGQRRERHDYVANSKDLVLEADGKHLTVRGLPVDLATSGVIHSQLCEFTKVPRPYYDRMLAETPDLLATNINTWLHRKAEPRMVRTFHPPVASGGPAPEGRARALLSNAYRPLDNDQLLEAALPPLLHMGVEVLSCEVTETKLYLKVVDSRIKKDLPTGVSLGQGHHRFDTCSPALVLSNSEVGYGALAVHTSIYTGGCTNMMVISERSKRTAHLGGRAELGEEVYRMLSDTTRKLTDAALWAQIGDVVRAAFEEAQFEATLQRIGQTAKNEIVGDVQKVVEVTAKKFEMTDGERGSVLQHLIRGGDLTQYGLMSAITRTAEDLDSYDRASQFEVMGGKLIELPANDWRVIAEAA